MQVTFQPFPKSNPARPFSGAINRANRNFSPAGAGLDPSKASVTFMARIQEGEAMGKSHGSSNPAPWGGVNRKVAIREDGLKLEKSFVLISLHLLKTESQDRVAKIRDPFSDSSTSVGIPQTADIPLADIQIIVHHHLLFEGKPFGLATTVLLRTQKPLFRVPASCSFLVMACSSYYLSQFAFFEFFQHRPEGMGYTHHYLAPPSYITFYTIDNKHYFWNHFWIRKI